MLCLRCQNEEFAAGTVGVPHSFRGDEFTVTAPAMVCARCGWIAMTDAQANALCALTAAKYGRRHGAQGASRD